MTFYSPTVAADAAMPGDLLLFHNPLSIRDPGSLISAGIRAFTGSRFNHAALALGDGLMVEATGSGVDVTQIADYPGTILPVPVMYLDDRQRDEVLAFAAGRVGWRYGFLTAGMIGLRTLFPGLPTIKRSNSLICSELVAEALEWAGYNFDRFGGPAHVSPGDLAEMFLGER